MCQELNSKPSGCHGGLQKRKSMEELGYHKATLSSTLAVVICGTKYHFFTLVLHLSATMQPTFQCVLICGPDMMYTFRLCPCLLQTDVRQRCPLKVSAAICAENTLHALTKCTHGARWHAFTRWTPVMPRYYVLSFLNAASEGLWNMGGHESDKRKCIGGA